MIEYDRKWSRTFAGRTFKYERRSKTNLWGRHGGGWDVKVGVQAASWRSLFTLTSAIFSLGGSALHVTKTPEAAPCSGSSSSSS